MSGHRRSVVLHAHFYQPPREDPWLCQIAREPSAAPFHDWNERILHECYRAVVSARVPDPHGRIVDVVNTLAHVSFNVGPTLMEWLDGASPRTRDAILQADAESTERCGGHGNAIAMPYHHTILPLATRRDKMTEVRWGIEDFRRRFGRAPDGMWLPETAVDDETLDVLAAQGIRFTILAPHQVRTVPPRGEPGLYRTQNGREIAVFCYDGERSHDVAFGPALRDASAWAARLLERDGRVVLIAADGETYGHHHIFGEMALATLVRQLATHPSVVVENCASVLARAAPGVYVELVENTSWSCVHGVERWRAACGCKMHPERTTQQDWRAPLRESLDWLAEQLHAVYEREAGCHIADPWELRDAYGWAVSRGEDAMVGFVRDRTPDTSADDRVRLAELLELERNALRMFTSCGWFFDDIGGLESRQVLRYAARAIELAGSDAARLDAGVRERLAPALSNEALLGTGAAIYLQGKPRHPAQVVAAACATFGDRFALGSRDVVPPSFEVEADAGGRPCVSVRHVGTGRQWCLPVAVSGSRVGDLAVVVTEPSDGSHQTLRFADLPEPTRRAIGRRIAASVTSRAFTDGEAAALQSGDDLRVVIASALQRAVEALDGGATVGSVSRVLDLLDLLDLLEHPFPYDAKTAFFHTWRRRVDGPDMLRPIALRLGFV
jgi:alpha-amylase/alpha-mannosidase (GH57 family)